MRVEKYTSVKQLEYFCCYTVHCENPAKHIGEKDCASI